MSCMLLFSLFSNHMPTWPPSDHPWRRFLLKHDQIRRKQQMIHSKWAKLFNCESFNSRSTVPRIILSIIIFIFFYLLRLRLRWIQFGISPWNVSPDVFVSIVVWHLHERPRARSVPALQERVLEFTSLIPPPPHKPTTHGPNARERALTHRVPAAPGHCCTCSDVCAPR